MRKNPLKRNMFLSVSYSQSIALGIEQFCSIDACRMSYDKTQHTFLLAAEPLFSNSMFIAEFCMDSRESKNSAICSLNLPM